MQRLKAVSCLFIALFARAAFPIGENRVKVEVVQTHTGVTLGNGSGELSAISDSTQTQCNRASGIYSKDLGFYCRDSESAPQPESTPNHPGYSFFYDVSVILPDDAHVVLHCSTFHGKGCEGFPDYPDGTSIACSDFVYSGTRYKDCTARGATATGIGVYEASLEGGKVIIFGTHWQRNYLKDGTWKFSGPPPQEQSPASGQEAKPANTPAPAPAATADATIDPQLMEQAKAGDPVAQYKLGYDYYLGHGISQDYAQAAIWWRRAADQGFADAQNNLGVLYNAGKGVPQSYSEAYFWENLAAARANGSLQAQFAKNRDDSASKLGFFERLRVQKRASKWAAVHPVPPSSAEAPPAPAQPPQSTPPPSSAPPKSEHP